MTCCEKDAVCHAPADTAFGNPLISNLARAREAQKTWRERSFAERRKIILRMRSVIAIRIDQVVGVITECTGKTRIDALSTEVVPAAMAADYYGKKAGSFLRNKKVGPGNLFLSNKRSYLLHEPWGVVAIITPWNYPFGTSFHEVVMALMAGNAVLLKMATITRRVGLCIKEIADDAGVPDGLFQLIDLPGPEAGSAFINAGVNKIFFTGSTTAGRELMRCASEKLIPVCLELGGKDAMIVREDAPLDRAANGALWAGLSNCGQSCGGIERIYVHEKIADRFSSLLAEKLQRLRMGRETAFDVDIGTLTTPQQYLTVKQQVEEALDQGARVIASIGIDDETRLLHPAMLIDRVKPEMRLMREETFGPLLAIDSFANDDEAVAKANDSSFGLTASIWTRNIRQARLLAPRLDVGVVTFNDHLMSHGLAETPWGGYKESGFGRTHGEAGFLEMTQTKVVVHDVFHMLPKNPWWYPHSEAVYAGLKGLIDVLYGVGARRKLAGGMNFVKLLPWWIRKW